MQIFSWARPTPIHEHRRLPDDRPVWIVSDLHLGDGTRSDSFLGKDREFLEFLEAVRAAGARLVVAGDAIDFHQAWSITRVIKAHARIMGELSRLAADVGVIYLWGNHDHDISLFKELLRFDVCESLEIGDKLLIKHGYQYDPFIGPKLDQSHVATRIHHLFERMLGTWLRLPLEHFYSGPNRLMFWVAHKAGVVLMARNKLLRWMGHEERARESEDIMTYWTHTQLGDPQCVFEGVREAMQDERHHPWLVTGHSHLPGVVELAPGRRYANTGSWTFGSSQYAVWDGEEVVVRDWISSKQYGDHLYRPLLNRSFRHLDFPAWWRENYLGWLRFRTGVEGRLSLRGAHTPTK